MSSGVDFPYTLSDGRIYYDSLEGLGIKENEFVGLKHPWVWIRHFH
jgi:hypothetical protein